MNIEIKAGEKKKMVISVKKEISEYVFDLGKAAELDLLVVCKAVEKENYKIKIVLNHNEPDAKSKVKMNTVLYDRTEVHMYGNMIVGNGISEVSTELKQRALLLSKNAKVTLDPILEIDDNRLTGLHAAVIASPDPAQLYYLQSRGLKKSQAEDLLAQSLLHIPEGYSTMD